MIYVEQADSLLVDLNNSMPPHGKVRTRESATDRYANNDPSQIYREWSASNVVQFNFGRRLRLVEADKPRNRLDSFCKFYGYFRIISAIARPSENDSPSPKTPAVDQPQLAPGADQLAEAILNPSTLQEQLKAAVFEAEFTQFSATQDASVGVRLIELALEWRDLDDLDMEPVVWSAIRTGASMIPLEKVDLLTPLLEPGHNIETTLVTLKMVYRIFEAEPPTAPDAYPALADNVLEIANAFLNNYAVVNDRDAAAAQLSVVALATMWSSQLAKATELVAGLSHWWFKSQVIDDLKILLNDWVSNQPMVARESHIQFLKDHVIKIEESYSGDRRASSQSKK